MYIRSMFFCFLNFALAISLLNSYKENGNLISFLLNFMKCEAYSTHIQRVRKSHDITRINKKKKENKDSKANRWQIACLCCNIPLSPYFTPSGLAINGDNYTDNCSWKIIAIHSKSTKKHSLYFDQILEVLITQIKPPKS